MINYVYVGGTNDGLTIVTQCLNGPLRVFKRVRKWNFQMPPPEFEYYMPHRVEYQSKIFDVLIHSSLVEQEAIELINLSPTKYLKV